jgi:MarR family transcriptional regulator, temperature-dependent positive regulator of motility
MPSAPLPDDEFELYAAPGHLVRRLQQIHTAVFSELVSDPDLTSPQFAVLSALHQTPDIDQVTLSVRLAIDRSTITDITSRLRDRKLIARRRDENDGRRNVLQLTAAGEKLYQKTLPEVMEVGRRIVQPLSSDDRARLLKSLTTIVADRDANFRESAGHYSGR